MTTMTLEALLSIMDAREDVALTQLEQNPAYAAVCKEQKKTEERVEELLQQLKKADRITIRRHYESELDKTDYERKAVYIQGLRDCSRLYDFLMGNEVCI